MSMHGLAAPANADAAPAQLRVLTLNVWGLPEPLSKQKRVRMHAIGQRLADSEYDIVALEELWVSRSDFAALRTRLSARFPWSKFFYGGAFGMGLALFSRFPIVRTKSISYDYNGLPVAVAKGDWIVGKGAGCATLAVPGLPRGLDVYLTHTVAAGGEDGPEWTRAPRITQTWQLAQWARDSAEQGRHVLVMGDLNCTPPSLSARLLRQVGGLADVYLATHPDVAEMAVTLSVAEGEAATTLPDPQRGIAELGVTCDSPLNSWTAGKQLDPRACRGAGKRLDYIYYTPPRVGGDVWARTAVPAACAAASLGQLTPLSCNVAFTDLIPMHNVSYTDHFGVEAVFATAPARQCADPTALYGETRADTGNATLADAAEGRTARAIECLNASVAALVRGLQQAERNQRFWLAAFLAVLLFAVGLCIGSGFQPQRGVGAVFAFLAVAAGFAGTTMLYTGLIWGEWEKRIYRTMLESMREELRCINRVPADTGAATHAHGHGHGHGHADAHDQNQDAPYHDASSSGSGSTDGDFALHSMNYPPATPAALAPVAPSSQPEP